MPAGVILVVVSSKREEDASLQVRTKFLNNRYARWGGEASPDEGDKTVSVAPFVLNLFDHALSTIVRRPVISRWVYVEYAVLSLRILFFVVTDPRRHHNLQIAFADHKWLTALAKEFISRSKSVLTRSHHFSYKTQRLNIADT
jgi:hypothetical protein